GVDPLLYSSCGHLLPEIPTFGLARVLLLQLRPARASPRYLSCRDQDHFLMPLIASPRLSPPRRPGCCYKTTTGPSWSPRSEDDHDHASLLVPLWRLRTSRSRLPEPCRLAGSSKTLVVAK
uniref:Uncharacterized protein n=1 Tax=Triticum urartu TaxID=4572 RepID=A0A8R7Q387_TRIUA